MEKHGLGRGLESLIPSIDLEERKTDTIGKEREASFLSSSTPLSSTAQDNKQSLEKGFELPIAEIQKNPYQPRTHMDEKELLGLARSIEEHGVLEPIIVTKTREGYELIAGERRMMAAKKNGMTMIPAVVRSGLSDQQKLELALIENIQRENLNPMEKARAYKRFVDDFGLTQEQIGEKVGKSRVGVTNTLHLLDLPLEIQKGVEHSEITEGHARAILMVKGPEKRRALYQKIKKSNLSVRQTERIAQTISVRSHIRKTFSLRDSELEQKKDFLEKSLGTKVQIIKRKRGGRIMIEYFSRKDLDEICKKISG